MHNLLPHEERHQLDRTYQLRVATVALILGVIVMCVACVALLPSVLAVHSDITLNREEQSRRMALVSEDGSNPRTVLERTARMTALLQEQTKSESFSQYLSDILRARSPEVVVHGVLYERDARQLIVEGTARTREALVSYTRRLEAEPAFESTKLPIEDLALSTNLEFRLTLALGTPAE